MARYRRLRTDILTHPKTIGLPPPALHIFVQAMTANIAGVLERSLSKMAQVAGGLPVIEIERAIDELERRGLAKWWDDLEVLWLVEAADEQCQNANGWAAAKTTVETQHPEVRKAFAERYTELCPDSWATVPPTVPGTVFHQEAGNRKQVTGSRSVADKPATKPKTQPSEDSCEIAQYLYDAIREHSPDFMAGAPPSKLEAKLLGWARDIDVGLRNDGMTVDGCKAAVDAAHRGSDEFWRPNVLSGRKLRKHYETLKIRTNGSKPKSDDYGAIAFDELREEMDNRWPTTK